MVLHCIVLYCIYEVLYWMPIMSLSCKYSLEVVRNLLSTFVQCHELRTINRSITNGSPTYLADMMTSCNPVRSTRSSHKVNLLVVLHQKSNKYSEKAFAVVGPRLWNELLTDELRGCNSVDTFKKKLNTMLFKKTLLTFIMYCFVFCWFFVIM